MPRKARTAYASCHVFADTQALAGLTAACLRQSNISRREDRVQARARRNGCAAMVDRDDTARCSRHRCVTLSTAPRGMGRASDPCRVPQPRASARVLSSPTRRRTGCRLRFFAFRRPTAPC
eukprot:5352381-Prymnesium_polylepis.2